MQRNKIIRYFRKVTWAARSSESPRGIFVSITGWCPLWADTALLASRMRSGFQPPEPSARHTHGCSLAAIWSTFQDTGRLKSNYEFEALNMVRNWKLQRAVVSGS